MPTQAASISLLLVPILRSLAALVVVLTLTVIPGFSRGVLAKAPPMATTILDVEAREAPSYDAAVVAVIPSGRQVELTGEAAPGFLAVYDAGGVVWVPAQFLALGDRPGIDTAVTVVDTPLLDAPMRDAQVEVTVPEGEAVILTGARVNGYDASSYEGVGGWIFERNLAR